jgi:anti-anti-sigma factor
MDMQVGEVGEVMRVALSGRLDTAGAGAIEPRFAAAVVANGRATLVDMTEVAFLASLGVRMIISTARSLAFRGGRMVLYGATPPVMEIIETTLLHEIVPVAATEAEALELVKSPPH